MPDEKKLSIPELLGALELAEASLQSARDRVAVHQREEREAKARVDELQRQIDEAIAKRKKAAPRATEWAAQLSERNPA